ncbi:hypothetical protein M413DRAFT_232881 [Hebeloma cylindrosporum]|uniref:Uncharacterized protein n=1 Tax=Hebeloma cylindrosporum TaxID=76867 RepID=A0A0C2Z5K3_HEBCY|nr:hypothetical protein M413DRAFT_232881 [Hebeloma cylindrosporum h7]
MYIFWIRSKRRSGFHNYDLIHRSGFRAADSDSGPRPELEEPLLSLGREEVSQDITPKVLVKSSSTYRGDPPTVYVCKYVSLLDYYLRPEKDINY